MLAVARCRYRSCKLLTLDRIVCNGQHLKWSEKEARSLHDSGEGGEALQVPRVGVGVVSPPHLGSNSGVSDI